MAFGFRVPWAPASWACGVGIVSPEIGHATEVQQVLACRPCEGGFCLWLFVHGAQAYGAGGLCWPSSGGRVFYAIVCWGRAGQVDGAVRGRCHGQVKDSGQSQQPAGRCYVCSCWWKQSEHEMRKWKNPKSTRPIFILARLQMCTVHLFFFFFLFRSAFPLGGWAFVPLRPLETRLFFVLASRQRCQWRVSRVGRLHRRPAFERETGKRILNTSFHTPFFFRTLSFTYNLCQSSLSTTIFHTPSFTISHSCRTW